MIRKRSNCQSRSLMMAVFASLECTATAFRAYAAAPKAWVGRAGSPSPLCSEIRKILAMSARHCDGCLFYWRSVKAHTSDLQQLSVYSASWTQSFTNFVWIGIENPNKMEMGRGGTRVFGFEFIGMEEKIGKNFTLRSDGETSVFLPSKGFDLYWGASFPGWQSFRVLEIEWNGKKGIEKKEKERSVIALSGYRIPDSAFFQAPDFHDIRALYWHCSMFIHVIWNRADRSQLNIPRIVVLS